jgi:hypothetical protein
MSLTVPKVFDIWKLNHNTEFESQLGQVEFSFYFIIYYLNIFIHGSLSVACFSKGRGLKLLKRYKTKSKPKV